MGRRNSKKFRDRLTAGLWVLVPAILVRIQIPEQLIVRCYILRYDRRMQAIQKKIFFAALFGATAFFGFGCASEAQDASVEFREEVLNKIGIVAQIPKTWNEDPRTADPSGPADYHEFVVPPGRRDEDKVAGNLGFRLVPRIAKNTLEDEIESLKPFIKESAGSEGAFSAVQPTRIGEYEARQIEWRGTTKNGVEEIWWYTFAFVGDDVVVVYYFDELADAQRNKAAYENVLRTIDRR